MKTDSAFRRLILAALACAALCGAARAENETRDVDTLVFSGQSLPPVTAEEKALATVPFAEEAPAVVLLKGEQLEFRQDCAPNNCFHSTFFRRVKLLNAAGVAGHASRKITLPPGESTKFEGAMARVTLPDGREIDASDNVKYEVTAKGHRLLSISFPGAVPGAILDLQYKMRGLVGADLEIQERLPVVEARFVTLFPKATRSFLRVFPLHIPADRFLSSIPMPADLGAPIPIAGRRVMSFSARNMPPAPEEPNMPPYPDRVARIIVAQTSYPGMSAAQEAYGSFWDNARLMHEWAKIYERRRSREAQAFAEQVAGNEKTVRGKAEAIRAALARRFVVDCAGGGRRQPSADDALSAGRGCGGDVVYLAMTMLRAVGVEAVPVAFHRRDSGLTVPPQEFISPNDVMLRLPGETGPIYWAPAEDLPVGLVPYQARGVIGIPYSADDKERPLVFPLPAADERVVSSFTRGTLDAEGTLAAETTWTYAGEAAAARRAALRGREPKQRVELFERELRAAGTKTAAVIDADVPALDDAAPALKIVVRWRAEGFARRVGTRIFLPVLPTTAIAPEAWAATGRRNDGDMGAPAVRTDATSITLPAGYAPQLPPRVSLAGPASRFELEVQSPAPGRIEAKRTLRRDQPLFPAAQWSALRDFHLKASEAETALVALESPAP